MADLEVAYLQSLVKDSLRRAKAEGAAKAERMGQMHREIARRFWEARGLDGDPDAEEEEEEEQFEEEDEEEVAKEDAVLERIMLLELQQGDELRARYRKAEERILDYDPKQGGAYYTRLDLVYDLASFDHDEECE